MQHVRGASTCTNLLEYAFQRKEEEEKEEEGEAEGDNRSAQNYCQLRTPKFAVDELRTYESRT